MKKNNITVQEIKKIEDRPSNPLKRRKRNQSTSPQRKIDPEVKILTKNSLCENFDNLAKICNSIDPIKKESVLPSHLLRINNTYRSKIIPSNVLSHFLYIR